MMIKATVKDNGFEGILLPGDGRKNKVVIVMSGSNGGMKLTKQCAEFYHKNGIPALALAIFGTKGTQPFLDKVPVEYVENAIAWLRSQGYEKIRDHLVHPAGAIKVKNSLMHHTRQGHLIY